MQESPVTQVGPLVQGLYDALVELTDVPFVVFGHSVGALIGFEFIRELRRQGNHLLRGLVVSGSSAPQLSDHDPQIHSLPEPEFIEKLRAFEGTPPEILDNPEIRQLFLPVLRSDFALREHYTYEVEPPLSCPIVAFGGVSDHEVSQARLEAWCEQSTDRFTVSMFSGGHFFLHTARALVLQQLRNVLDDCLQEV
ncbi:MAG: hypothetical protein NPIRA02_35370 [Nitrospirales bacterium]|nr:MAG: hypothetical protein NPIRA02_35370 [Nitrospirales bacterium]